MVRHLFYLGALITFVAVGTIYLVWPPVLWSLLVFVPLLLVGIYDTFQAEHTILRNFPILGHGRYLLELIRPEIQQYFIETNTDGKPLSREQRSVVYQRAKHELDTLPFGTQHDVYEPGYEWVNHSLMAYTPCDDPPRIIFGEKQCAKPYHASMLNISAMSFGSLSPTAIMALNGGAEHGGFYHNTGEGGVSPYHLKPGGDIVWQIGTAYFGCRTKDGDFDPEMFRATATKDAIKMIEIKLSQGAKPGHGGILPGAKVNAEIAAIRGVEIGKDVISPPTHQAFEGPQGLLRFVETLRELSGGKPVGFKLCMGRPSEFLSICKAMVETGLKPDFITVDGKEGGTGAAPLEFSNSVGMPLREGLRFVHNALVGCNLRTDIKIIASGKVITAFDMFRLMALGADTCNSARAFMLALGCIQALRCNSNVCPAGVATQDRALYKGIVVPTKSARVYRYHKATIHNLMDLMGCTGLKHPDEVTLDLIMRRINELDSSRYDELFPTLEPGELLDGEAPAWIAQEWARAKPNAYR